MKKGNVSSRCRTEKPRLFESMMNMFGYVSPMAETYQQTSIAAEIFGRKMSGKNR